MSFRMSPTLLACLMASSTLIANPTFAADKKPVINVSPTYASSISNPGISWLFPQDTDGADSVDTGTYLTSIVGVSTSRMGGHGTDPVIRGQQQTQLNIINDGAMIHGGCPSRMDPPTSYAPPRSFDKITVLKGYQSVRYGAGGTGGTVLLERNPVAFTTPTFKAESAIGGEFETNGVMRSVYGDATAGNIWGQIRALVTDATGNDYTDGGGHKVRSAFKAKTAAIMPIWTPNADTTIKSSFENTQTDDVLYAGMMDAPESMAQTNRFSVDHKVHGDLLQAVSFSAYTDSVNHDMDSYSLRASSGMKMRTLSDSDTFGGRATADLSAANVPFTIGIDLQNNVRDAWSYTGMASGATAATLSSRTWPDVLIRQTGLFVEADPKFSATTRMRIGARYDYVQAEARAANNSYGGATPNSLYMLHYGKNADNVSENNFGGLLRLEHDIASSFTFFSGISRSVRTADATERFMASNSMTASSRRVGNPDLDPETHHQLDMGMTHRTGASETTLSGYVDYVSDYILKDTARGQSGILVNNGATIYRNIDAHLLGLELENQYRLNRSWNLTSSLSYTYGNNDEDHDALGQIPPLQLKLGTEYAQENWLIGTRFTAATRQTRIDDQTAKRDLGKTGGYGTLDLYAKINAAPFEVRLGVDNLLDKQYANHLNRGNTFDPVEYQVNEPGRSFGMQVSAKF